MVTVDILKIFHQQINKNHYNLTNIFTHYMAKMLNSFIELTNTKCDQLIYKVNQIAKIVSTKENRNDFIEVQEINAEQNSPEYNMHVNKEDQNDGNVIKDYTGLQQNINEVVEQNETENKRSIKLLNKF
ncbi:uncharacterized protein DS421_12g362110 [Arachis hypogaea]|nr:uncharacterized protein DS421_12g362110 [Arachis hypogaea]